jgi:hypothetical protein
VLALPTEPDSEATRYPAKIEMCTKCGHVYNAEYNNAFDQCSTGGCTMYNSGGAWKDHMLNVAQVVMDLHGLDNGPIVEIGAGRGEFADLFQGYDYVAYEPSADAAECEKVATTRKMFFNRLAMCHEKPDLIVMRHVLEHFPDPWKFVSDLRLDALTFKLLPTLVVEVPNILPALKARRLEDWVYEHPQHFTPNSLRTLLEQAGWSVSKVETYYNDEVILAIATLSDLVYSSDGKVAKAYENLKRTGVHLHCPIFWGGAGKCATLINLLEITGPVTVVDSDERKWGCYVPGTDYVIQDPEILKDLKPSRIIVATTWRTADIAAQLKALGLETLILNISEGELQLYEDTNV